MSFKTLTDDTIDKSIPTSNTGTWRDVPKRPRTNRLLKDIRDNLEYFEAETIKQEDTTEFTRELLTKLNAEEVRTLLELGTAALASLVHIRGTDTDSVMSQKKVTEEIEALEALIEYNTYFKGKFVSEVTLNTATSSMDPVPKYGDFAIVDPGAGEDAVFYVWDNDNSNWIRAGDVATSTALGTSFDPTTLFDPSITDVQKMGDALKVKVDAALTKTFAPWQPEVIGGAGIDLPNVIDLFGSSDPITLTGSTVRMERTGFPTTEYAYLLNGLKSDSISFGDTTSLYYKVKSSLDAVTVSTPVYIGFSNSAFDASANAVALISGGTLSLVSIGEPMGSGDITEFANPIEVPITDDSEYCFSYDKSLNKVTFFVDGVEIASHTFATDFGFDVVTGSVYVDATNYQGDPSTLTLWSETEFLSNPTHPIAGLEPLIIGEGNSAIDESKYPENPEGKGYEIVGLAQPAQWDALGKEVKNGDFIVFDNAGIPVPMNEEPAVVQETGNSEAAVMSQKAVTEALKDFVTSYSENVSIFDYGSVDAYVNREVTSGINFVSGVSNSDGMSLDASVVVDWSKMPNDSGALFGITTIVNSDPEFDVLNYANVYKNLQGKKQVVLSYFNDSLFYIIDSVTGKSFRVGGYDTKAKIGFTPVDDDDIASVKYVKDSKIQVKEIVTANKTLTASDSGKLLIINADGITITMPASYDFNIDIAKMDESFITIVQSAGNDNFREGTAAISVIRDVSITNSGIPGKEWLAIGAYEV